MRVMVAERGSGEPISLGGALLTGKKVPPDVTGLLAEDHATVLGWFDWYEKSADGATKLAVARRICRALRAHMAGEEAMLYPAAQPLDPKLVDKAVNEHDEAKQLMGRIEEASTSDETHVALMTELRNAIDDHVEAEESELFPKVRSDGVDLYAIGREVASRRVEVLFDAATTAQGEQNLKEFPEMTVSTEHARDYFVLGLKNAHATAKEARTMVEAQIGRLDNYPKLKQKLESHLVEKDAQLGRLEQILERCGESPSALKSAAAKMMAGMGTLTSAAADDEVIKNSFGTLGLAKFSAAAFETLILFGEAAGEDEALRPLQLCLSEERGMAAFIEENLRATGMRFLQLRSEGKQASH